MGTQMYIAELCGIKPAVISSVINKRVKSIPKNAYKKLSNLFGKSKDEIIQIEKELIVEVRKEDEIKKKEEILKEAKLINDRKNRLASMEVGKKYKVSFNFNIKKSKGKNEVLSGRLIEKHDRLFVFQSLNYKFSATVHEIAYGIVKIEEIKK
ncbi:hypothetical protein [Peptoniphilus rhinitidis]|uniref:hypothetical protein n=1 Tax=Peptoniphilus rhinitidis TaxID=1175452 RepID=UPI0002E6121B|nr:hypothetical protein [Peptoniphilus rhinitidis]